MTRIITLTSSSDGVGKSTVAVHLAAGLAAAGKRVCLFELVADAATRLDVPAVATLSDRLAGMADSIPLTVPLPAGFDLLVGSTGRDWLRELSSSRLMAVTAGLQSLDGYDVVVLDAGAGTSQGELAFSLASPELWLVVTPEPALLSATYTRLKLLYAEGYAGRMNILVNKAENHTVGRHTYNKFREVARFYLDMELPLAGILEDMDDTTLAGFAPAGPFAGLVDQLLDGGDDPASIDMVSYGHRFLQAARNDGTDEGDNAMTAAFSDQPTHGDIRQQLDVLADQVDDLIAEIERLRSDGSAAALIAMPPVSDRQAPPPARCDQACVAALASGSEQVTVQGESFPVYRLRKAGGQLQRFAFHSIDDDLEEPEPQTRLS